MLVSQKNPHTRLFVACFDGTGNDKYKDPEHITNIGTLYDQVQAAKKSNVRNINGYYVPGVGTQDDAFTRNLDGGLGYSYGPRMEKMYLEFINQAKQWRDQDPKVEISIVSTGFSRGAVTAAMFTRMVHERGIQNPKDMKIDRGPDGEILKLTPTHPPLVPPGRTAQAVGLLDPVATGDMNLRDTRLPPSVVSGLQLTARDERRDLFPAKDIIDPGRTPDGRLLNLVNPGAHSDIGGSYRLDGLSVRNGNLLTDYVNTLSDTPFLKPRTVSTAPEMNVIHHSEQHQSFYTTVAATTLGQRVHVKDLAGTTVSLNRTDAQALDTGLHAQFPLRPVALSPERSDPAVPAFARNNGAPEPQSWQQQMRHLQQQREHSHAPEQWQVPMQADARQARAAADKPSSLHDDPHAFLDRMLLAAQSGDRDQFRQMTQTLANEPPGRALRAEAIDTVNQQEQQAAQQAMLAQQQQQQQETMRIGGRSM
ncbi:phospholipase effector Tle1 domain-containing protein [Xanthomonas axonopodis pv. cajani]|uniref:phospholipase effector Tle1 domain-containing protein n=1 Tax=Xanthomonas axonopodis TaxID=53413 RepID=UPI0035579EAA